MAVKRKLCAEDDASVFRLNDLNQDLLERVLSWIPTSSFFRLTSVCKRFKAAADSAAFRLACSQVPSRRPWFFMVDSRPHRSNHPVVFDSSEGNWKKLNCQETCEKFVPVAAAAGLLCFLRPDGGFVVTNPVTASSRRVDSPVPDSTQPVPAVAGDGNTCESRDPTPPLAIAMTSNGELGFKLIVLSGDLPNLKFRQYSSSKDQWGELEDISAGKKSDSAVESATNDDDGDCTQYFLSKCGNVVSTDIQRSPSKQYSSILTHRNGEEVLHFLSSSGTVVACNLTRRTFFEYPRLLPVFSEYSIDLIECGGQMYVVLLSEFLETASLRVWVWDEIRQFWRQIAAAPPSMSHKFYGKKVDINCSGSGREMLVCVNSAEVCSYLMCDLGENEWVELPECCINGERKEFVCAFSFEPRIEA